MIAGVHPIMWLQLSLVNIVNCNLDYYRYTTYSVALSSALMYTNYCYLGNCGCTSSSVASITIDVNETLLFCDCKMKESLFNVMMLSMIYTLIYYQHRHGKTKESLFTVMIYTLIHQHGHA